VDREPAPSGADLQHVVPLAQPQPPADALVLGDLGVPQPGLARLEHAARVGHRLIQHQPEELVAEVVVGVDVFCGAAAGVPADAVVGAGDQAAEPRRAAFHPADRGHVPQKDPQQARQLETLPFAERVALRDAQASAEQRPAVEPRIPHAEDRVELRVRLAGGVAALVVDQRQPAAVQIRELPQHQPAGQPIDRSLILSLAVAEVRAGMVDARLAHDTLAPGLSRCLGCGWNGQRFHHSFNACQ